MLARASDVIGRYQGNVAAARRSWAARNPAVLHGFIRAYVNAIGWLYDPANHAEACAILQASVAGLSKAMAEASYARLLDPELGFFRDGNVRLDGVRTVLDLRQKYGAAHRVTPDPARYVDMRYWQEAMQ